MSTPPETPTTAEPPPPAPARSACRYCGADVAPGQEWCLDCGSPTGLHVRRAPSWRVPVAIVATVVLLAGVAVAVAFAQLSDDSKDVAGLNSAATTTTSAATPAPAATPPATTGPTSSTTTPTTTTPSSPGAPEDEGDAPSSTTPTTPTTPGASTTPTAPSTSTTPSAPSATTPAAPAGGTVAAWPAGRSAYTAVLQSAPSKAAAETTAKRLAGRGVAGVGVLHSNDFSSLEPGYWVVYAGHFPAFGKAESTAERLQGQGAPGAYARFVKP